jgi:hypothetical protein
MAVLSIDLQGSSSKRFVDADLGIVSADENELAFWSGRRLYRAR